MFLLDKTWFFVILLLTVLFCYFFVKIINYLNFWKKRGVVHLKAWSSLGNLTEVILKRRNIVYVIEDLYKLFPNKRYFGIHQLNTPTLVIKDLDLIKRITIKDFDHFVDRSNVLDNDLEPLLGRNLLSLTGQKWKEMRVTLSPTFTGNKIRIMFTLMKECAKRFNEHFLSRSERMIEFEAKELMSRCANDIIATCAFGVDCNSVKDEDDIFYTMGRSINKALTESWLKMLVQIWFPRLAMKFNISLMPNDITSFFNDAVTETIRQREEKNIIRPDMIHLLKDAMKESRIVNESKHIEAGFAAVDNFDQTISETVNRKKDFTVEDFVAQAFLFFLAGYETVSTVLSHCLHELAINLEIQKKLQAEIDQEFEKCGGDISYEAVTSMKYLDAVISETLRKWPTVATLNRICVKDFVIEGDQTFGEKSLLLEKGTGIIIPIYGIHRNDKYYLEPDRFDPERFNEENRNKLVPYSYLPFGLGPRNCIGSRFALVELKTLLTYILSKFDIVPTSQTEVPLKLSPDSNFPCPKGFWLGLRKRSM